MNISDSHILSHKEWDNFYISNLATILKSRGYPKKDRRHGNIPYIGRTRFRNGIIDYISSPTSKKHRAIYKNVIAVNTNGSTGYAFYHPYYADFSNGVQVLSFQSLHLSTPVALFLCTCIRQQRKKFSYGFELVAHRLSSMKIKLPVNEDGKPDWKFMKSYMQKLIKQSRRQVKFYF